MRDENGIWAPKQLFHSLKKKKKLRTTKMNSKPDCKTGSNDPYPQIGINRRFGSKSVSISGWF